MYIYIITLSKEYINVKKHSLLSNFNLNLKKKHIIIYIDNYLFTYLNIYYSNFFRTIFLI